ncbi:disease resistance protein RML1B-like [Quercus lobata]|uniref:disease resistance protein RML1B-like n=1 Tax=Quercus lobata TaxID=97700 RepID=UPI0012472963|nr:disease resistance protein RML1B-like [Quercus lobata]
MEENVNIRDVDDGVLMIKNSLCHKRVLLVLDDVNQFKQLEKLAGEPNWFGQGSRVIITTREEHLLIRHKIYEDRKLDDDDALHLFSLKAFNKDHLVKDYLKMSKHFVNYAKGLPLAVDVLGSLLYNRRKVEWESECEAIEGLVLELGNQHTSKEAQWNLEAFSNMPNLKLLIIHGVPFLHGPKHLSNDLRYLDWSEYPSKSLPSSFQPDELVKLLMCKRKIELLWEGIKHFDNLKSIKLNDSINLIATPEFSGVPNLEKLMLEGCINLLEVHSSITVHKKLTLLNLKGCKNLNFLLSKIEMESLEILILSGCSKIKRIPEFMRNIESDCKKLVYIPGSSFSFMSLEDLNVAGNLKLDRQSKNFLSLNLSSLSPEKWNRLSKSLNSILVWAPDLDHLKGIYKEPEIHFVATLSIVIPGSKIPKWFKP